MEFKYYVYTVEQYMELLGYEKIEICKKYGSGTKYIALLAIFYPNGDSDRFTARYKGPQTYDYLMEKAIAHYNKYYYNK